jgi:hypothetical protein
MKGGERNLHWSGIDDPVVWRGQMDNPNRAPKKEPAPRRTAEQAHTVPSRKSIIPPLIFLKHLLL